MGAFNSRNQISLVQEAERLGKRTIALGLIPSFTVQHFADNVLFSVIDYPRSLTPAEAYLCFQRLIEEFDVIPSLFPERSPGVLVEWAIAEL